MSQSARLLTLGRATHAGGRAFTIHLPETMGDGDSAEASQKSTARLFENGVEIGPAHAMHSEVAENGHGRFSHWGRTLYLSSSDGSRVDGNGRVYSLLVEKPAAGVAAVLSEASTRVEHLADDQERFALAERLFNALVPGVHLSEFGRTFFDDREFADIYRKFDAGNYRAYDRRYTVGQLSRHAASLPGEFAECGVYRGATAYLMSRALARSGTEGRKVHLFDSFAGLSRPAAEDGAYWSPGDMAVGLDEVRNNLGDHLARIAFYPGLIPERFEEAAAHQFAFVHIDVDLYEPTRDALAFFYERMTGGGIMLCDDYGFASCPGARKAMDEFFAVRPETIIHLPTGQGLVIRQSG